MGVKKPLPPSPPPLSPVAPSQIPSSPGASELFSLKAEGSQGELLSHGHSLNNPPPPAPLATATSASAEHRPGSPRPCRAPSLCWGACFREWHHHPIPQAAQSSGRQLATSSQQHEATERHSPSPSQPRAGVLGCPPHFVVCAKSWHDPPTKLLSAGVMSLPSGELGAPCVLGAGEATVLPPPPCHPIPLGEDTPAAWVGRCQLKGTSDQSRRGFRLRCLCPQI